MIIGSRLIYPAMTFNYYDSIYDAIIRCAAYFNIFHNHALAVPTCPPEDYRKKHVHFDFHDYKQPSTW